MGIQASRGYYDFEVGLYLRGMFLVTGVPFLLMAILAVFLQVVADNRSRKFRADGEGVETEIPVDDSIDIAVFGDREPGASPDGKLLALEKRRIDAAETVFELVVSEEPRRAGIDPVRCRRERLASSPADLLDVVVSAAAPTEHAIDTIHRVPGRRSLLDEQPLLRRRDLDLNVGIHAEAISERLRDGDLSAFGNSHGQYELPSTENHIPSPAPRLPQQKPEEPVDGSNPLRWSR